MSVTKNRVLMTRILMAVTVWSRVNHHAQLLQELLLSIFHQTFHKCVLGVRLDKARPGKHEACHFGRFAMLLAYYF